MELFNNGFWIIVTKSSIFGVCINACFHLLLMIKIKIYTRNNKVAMRELNDNIDYNNVVIIWFSLCLQMKWNILLRSMHKRRRCLAFLILWFAFDHFWGPKKDKIFCPVFVLGMSMPSVVLCYICSVKA